MGTLIFLVYLVGFFLTWVIAYAMVYKNLKEEFGALEEPVMDILMSGVIGFIIAVFWPLVVVIFGIHRIATKHVGTKDDA